MTNKEITILSENLVNNKISINFFLKEIQNFYKSTILLYIKENNTFYSKVNKNFLEESITKDQINNQYFTIKSNPFLGTFFPIKNYKNEIHKIIYFNSILKTKDIKHFLKNFLPYIKLKIAQEENIKISNKISELNQEKEIFLQKINHEFRTPLNSIKGYSHLLFDSELNYEQKQQVLSITQSSEDLLVIINSLIDYKNSLTNSILNINTIFITDFIDHLYIKFQNKLNEKNIKMEFNVNTKQLFFLSDKIKLEMIYSILIDNAIKYSPNESLITIVIDYEENQLIFTIKDNGSGFSNEKSQSFEAFNQGDNSSTKIYRGLGLGLHVCQNLVKALSGEFSILFTEKNVGSTIQVKVKAEKPITNFKSIKKAFRGKILIVEDDIVNQMILSKNLELLGFTVDIANNGQEAIDFCIKENYLIVFMDCQMPVMDGYCSTQEIKKIKQNQLIIAFTAHSFIEDKVKCFQVGMDDFMTKPINLEILIQKITEHSGLAFKPMQEQMLDSFIDPEFGDPKESLEFAKGLINQFITTTEHDKKELNKLLLKQDWTTMNRIFHRLKSSFGQLGLINSKDLFAIWQKKESFSNKDIDLFNLHFDVAKICLTEWITKKENSNEVA